jgi:hypothetical protein
MNYFLKNINKILKNWHVRKSFKNNSIGRCKNIDMQKFKFNLRFHTPCMNLITKLRNKKIDIKKGAYLF